MAPDAFALVIEDEPNIRRFLRASLAAKGYRVAESATGSDGINQAAARAPDVVLLDLGLPDMDGLDVIRKIHEWGPTPIIVLSARDGIDDRVRALHAGATDYLLKPFGVDRLHDSIGLALRQATVAADRSAGSIFRSGELRIDLGKRQAFVGGSEVQLTGSEYGVLAVLACHAGRVLTHRQLLEKVWGPAYVDRTQSLRVVMARLRQKLEQDPIRPRYLLHESGVGYRLRVEDSPRSDECSDEALHCR